MFSKGTCALGVVILAIIAITIGSPAWSKELTAASGFPPSSAVNDGEVAFVKRISELTNNEITFKLYPLTLLTVPQMLNGLRDGVADAGALFPANFLAQMPESNLIGDLALLGHSPVAMAGAVTEYFLNCDACQAEFKRNNIVYLSSASAGVYGIQSMREFSKIADFKGAKIRSPNAAYNRWVEGLGGASVTLGGNEIFESLKQGVVEATLVSDAELLNLRMIDIVKDITLGAPTGTYHVINVGTVNRDTWMKLKNNERKAFLGAAAYAMAVTTSRFVTLGEKGLKEAKERGIHVHEASDELKKWTAAFVQKDTDVVAKMAEDRGVKDVKAKVAHFRELIAKWEKLTADAGTDVDRLSTIYETQIFDKIDPAAYAK